MRLPARMVQIRGWRERTEEIKAGAEAQARSVMDKMVRGAGRDGT